VSGLPHAASAFSSANASKHHTAARSALSTGGDSSRGCAANAFCLDVHALSAGGNRNATGSARQLFLHPSTAPACANAGCFSILVRSGRVGSLRVTFRPLPARRRRITPRWKVGA
jgi:hypothetical protein